VGRGWCDGAAQSGPSPSRPPRGPRTPSPAPGGFGGPARQPSAKMQQRDGAESAGARREPGGLGTGGDARSSPSRPGSRRTGVCGAAPRPPLDERRGSSSSAPAALGRRCRGSCPHALRAEAPCTPGPPGSSASRQAPAAVGALLFSNVTLEHRQLCGSSPSR